jgi:hypothetical protein
LPTEEFEMGIDVRKGHNLIRVSRKNKLHSEPLTQRSR